MESAVEFRRVEPRPSCRDVGEIDRTERIGVLFDQHGTELVAAAGQLERPGLGPGRSWRALRRGPGTHARALASTPGGVALGAFAGERLVGIGVVVPHLRPGIAQLAYLHVSAPSACDGHRHAVCPTSSSRSPASAGDSAMVVSATPSENTVRFYLGRGFQPMAEPLAELFELEPDDVHLRKAL